MPWLDVAVVDDADNVLPTGKSGEIVVRPREPNSIFAGYWRKEQATLAAWQNLWHHTGDLGYFDADGMLYFVDRKKDALRRRGENVSSVELETAILKHPDVAQVAVHAAPSELSEDEIKACLVLRPGAAAGPAALFGYFKENLPYYAIPRYVQVMDAAAGQRGRPDPEAQAPRRLGRRGHHRLSGTGPDRRKERSPVTAGTRPGRSGGRTVRGRTA